MYYFFSNPNPNPANIFELLCRFIIHLQQGYKDRHESEAVQKNNSLESVVDEIITAEAEFGNIEGSKQHRPSKLINSLSTGWGNVMHKEDLDETDSDGESNHDALGYTETSSNANNIDRDDLGFNLLGSLVSYAFGYALGGTTSGEQQNIQGQIYSEKSNEVKRYAVPDKHSNGDKSLSPEPQNSYIYDAVVSIFYGSNNDQTAQETSGGPHQLPTSVNDDQTETANATDEIITESSDNFGHRNKIAGDETSELVDIHKLKVGNSEMQEYVFLTKSEIMKHDEDSIGSANSANSMETNGIIADRKENGTTTGN